jgi:hypothetical protein
MPAPSPIPPISCSGTTPLCCPDQPVVVNHSIQSTDRASSRVVRSAAPPGRQRPRKGVFSYEGKEATTTAPRSHCVRTDGAQSVERNYEPSLAGAEPFRIQVGLPCAARPRTAT